MGKWSDVALTDSGSPVVACYDGQLAFWRGGDWEFGTCVGAPLALVCDEATLWVGDSGGGLTAWGPDGARLDATLDAPVVAMRGGAVRLVLDQRGRAWLHAGGVPRRLAGAPAAVGVAAGAGTLGIFGRDWVGVVDVSAGTVQSLPVPFEVRELAWGGGGMGWALADSGEVYRVAADLSRVEAVKLPGDASAVRGLSAGRSDALVWTATGGLFRVGAHAVRPLATGVRFAVADAFRVSCAEGAAPVVVPLDTP